MTTAELIKALAERLGVSQKQARSLLHGYTQAIGQQLAAERSVILRNFGSFSVKRVAEQHRFVPAKGERCLIPEHRRLGFKAARQLRDELNAIKRDE